MIKGKKAKLIRKIHRYLGLIIGIQFLFWSISGLYFSWTDIDEIHGDQFIKEVPVPSFTNLVGLDSLAPGLGVETMKLISVLNKPYYWINNQVLIQAETGEMKIKITKDEALSIADMYLIDGLKVKEIQLIEKTDKHHEFRENPLPVWAIDYDHPSNLTAYIDAKNGAFRRVRHDSWRWFDFLWMFHTMDYQGRDDFNNILLRVFSISGLLTVLSGYLLWYISSPTVRKIKKRISG